MRDRYFIQYLPPFFCSFFLLLTFFRAFAYTVSMSATYTHYLVAARAFSRLPFAIQTVIEPHFPLYFFGAQGADFCFFYRFLRPKTKNLGSYLHRQGGYDAFCVLNKLSARSLGLFAYSLGFITHYAADVTFHPFVYAQAGKSALKHSRIEGAMDVHFRESVLLSERYAPFLRKKLINDEVMQLFTAYSLIARKCGFPTLQLPSFLRAISLFNAYPPITSAIFPSKNSRLFKSAVNAENLPWTHPTSKQEYMDGANELFERTVDLASELFQVFCDCVQTQTPPPKTLFGKNYLTGI